MDKYDLLVSSAICPGRGAGSAITRFVIGHCLLSWSIVVLYWFFGTEMGCSLRATGANPNMARAQGINTNFNKVLGLMISNGLVALSGALLSQYQGFADMNMGRGAIVIGLAAVIIGEVIFGKIFHNFGSEAAGCGLSAPSSTTVVIQVVVTPGPRSNRSEAAVRHCGGTVPGRPLLEGQVLFRQSLAKRGRCKAMLEIREYLQDL